MTTSGCVLVDERQSRPWRELAVRLVDDDESRRPRLDRADGRLGLDDAGGVVRRAEKGERGLHPCDRVPRGDEIELEVGGALRLDDLGPGDARDVRVQLIGRFERQCRATWSAVGEKKRLEHLVRAVRGEDLLGGDVVQLRDRRPELGGSAIGISVPFDAAELRRERVAPARRRRLGRLVGVESNLDIHLRRVIALERAEVIAHLGAHHRASSVVRMRTDAASAGSPSASARAATCGATLASAASSRLTT